MSKFYLRFGECLQVMAEMPPACIDLILADLPYGTTQNEWDVPIPYAPLWAAYWRIAKPTTPVILTATQPFASALIASSPAEFRYDLIWRKNKATGFLNAKKQPLRQHESVLVFYKKAPFYCPQMTTGHKPGNYARRTQHSTNYGAQVPTEYGGSTERYPLSVIDIPIINNDSDEKQHPTQKPVELMAWLVRSYSRPNAIVLDNAMGAGTTGVASVQEGRCFVGIEKNPEFYEIAERRIRGVA